MGPYQLGVFALFERRCRFLIRVLSLTAPFPEINRKYSRFEVTNIYLGIRSWAVKTPLVEPADPCLKSLCPPTSIGRTEAPSPMIRDQRNLMNTG